MDWILTKHELLLAEEQGFRDARNGKRDLPVQRAIARAALRKVVEWAKIKATQLSAARVSVDGGPTEGGSEYSLGIDALLDSLKAAVEGK